MTVKRYLNLKAESASVGEPGFSLSLVFTPAGTRIPDDLIFSLLSPGFSMKVSSISRELENRLGVRFSDRELKSISRVLSIRLNELARMGKLEKISWGKTPRYRRV